MMALVLGRNPGEKVYIKDEYDREIEVEVIKAGGNLKLRISAPPTFDIIRGEIYNDSNS